MSVILGRLCNLSLAHLCGMNFLRNQRHCLSRKFLMPPSSLASSVFNSMAPAKPPPLTPVSLDTRECQNSAKAKSIPSSPSGPFTVNLSEVRPCHTWRAARTPSFQLPRRICVNIKCSDRHAGECAQDMITKVGKVTLPRDRTQDSQRNKGAGKAGTPGDDPRPAQLCGGYRDGPLKGEGKRKLESGRRTYSVSRAGRPSESPSFSRTSNSRPNYWRGSRRDFHRGGDDSEKKQPCSFVGSMGQFFILMNG